MTLPEQPAAQTSHETRENLPKSRIARSVLMIGSEAVPFAKTGGLADVLGALPAALARAGWLVTLVLPRYRGIAEGTLVGQLTVTLGVSRHRVGFYEAPLATGARVVFIDCPELYDRDELYGFGNVDYPDNAIRFAMLVRGALEFAGGRRDAGATLVHAHDWHAALAPVYLKTLYATHPVLGGTPSVLTIHNLAYQGLFEAAWLPRIDLPWNLFSIDEMEFYGRISFLKGGINRADIMTTVSPQYAKEIQTPEFGSGFDGILRKRGADLIGILNGIDAEQWDPSRDPLLPAPFGPDDLAGKCICKRELLARSGLATDDGMMARPIVAMISRMVDQKGFDLIASVADQLPRLGATFVVLGTGEDRYQDLWLGLARDHPDRFGVRVGFDEAAAHLIEAGADMFLMPSHFEPCGLNQMYSLRYGTIPVVRAVGGLADTVRNYSPRSAKATGFVFRDYSGSALLGALRRAIAVFGDKPRWRALQLEGMRQDHSWDRSAREYVKIYERALRHTPKRGERGASLESGAGR